jgi:hypothetical protein
MKPQGPATGPFLIPGAIIMTAKAKDPTPATRSSSPLVLFGIDSRGKPKGARFGKEHASLAMKAATQLQLKVLASNDPKVVEIAARLPVGRVHATGRTFVPFIRRDLYDKLVAAAANGNAHPTSPPNGSSGAQGSSPGGSAPHLPRNWQEIGVGDLVVANWSREDGWYEADVVEANDDMLTLRWRDYPRERRIVRHRLRLALLHPGPKPSVETGKSGKASGQARHDRTVPADPAANGPALPKDWDEIDLNHLVLAKTEGPWANWFEAIPVERAGDGFKLRWRDYGSLPPVIRPRFDLALICPNAA